MTALEDVPGSVDVRAKWPHEAHNFTPWLADHLHLLGEELGMKLEVKGREHPVGSLYLDILARDTDEDVLVAIENQLDLTDTDHLGGLLAYMAGCDAHVAIWIAPEFRYEYAKTLHRLNQWTRDEIRFYGVKIEAVKRPGEACAEARFRKVVFPGGWNKGITNRRGWTMSARDQRYEDFFRPLVDDLARMGFADRAVQYYGHSGRSMPSRPNRGIEYAASFDRPAVPYRTSCTTSLDSDAESCFPPASAWVTLDIRTGDDGLTKRIFDDLLSDRERIEASIVADPPLEWHWHRWDSYTFSTIDVRRDGSIDDPPERLDETRMWMLDLLVKFKEIFDPRAAKVLSRLPSRSDE
jgi:hypothetical protein